MKFDAITDYLLISEIRGRWGLASDSLMLHRAVMKGVLKVRMWLNGTFQSATPDDDGTLVPDFVDGAPVVGDVNAWCCIAGGQQTDAFEAVYSYAMQATAGGPRYWVLHEPCPLSRLLTSGVVMLDDLEQAEAILKPGEAEKWQAKSAATKEMGSMLRLISAMAADAYAYDPRKKERLATLECLQSATSMAGEKPMHGQTIAKYLDRAFSEYPPEYMKRGAAE
jgi:hypothetical protein